MEIELQTPPDLPPFEPLTQAHFREMFARILPSHYLQPLINPGPGIEMLEAYGALGARLSEALCHIVNGQFIATAEGGSYSTGTVEFFRDSTEFGAFRLMPGTVVGTVDGYEYETLASVVFDADDLGPHTTPVRALVRGWLYNKPGQVILEETTEVIPGSIDRVVRPIPSVSFPWASNYDPTVQVRQITDTTGGAAPMLDGLGYDRGLPRLAGESDDAYRNRIFRVSATITPRAINDTAIDILTAGGLARSQWDLTGVFDQRVQSAWDFPINQTRNIAVPNVPVPAYSSNIFVYDYAPTSLVQQARHRIYDEWQYRRVLVFVLPNNATYFDTYKALAQTLEQIKPAGVGIFYLLYAP